MSGVDDRSDILDVGNDLVAREVGGERPLEDLDMTHLFDLMRRLRGACEVVYTEWDRRVSEGLVDLDGEQLGDLQRSLAGERDLFVSRGVDNSATGLTSATEGALEAANRQRTIAGFEGFFSRLGLRFSGVGLVRDKGWIPYEEGVRGANRPYVVALYGCDMDQSEILAAHPSITLVQRHEDRYTHEMVIYVGFEVADDKAAQPAAWEQFFTEELGLNGSPYYY